MNQKSLELEAVSMQLNEIRQNSKFKKKFPKSIWESIFGLIEEFSLSKVCSYLKLDQGYVLKKLGKQSPLVSSKSLEFQEVFFPSPREETVVIELVRSDLKAKIEGPASCIKELKDLFKER